MFPSMYNKIFIENKIQNLNISEISDGLTYTVKLKGECSVFLRIFLLWMKTMHYSNTIRSHLVTIVPMAPFTPESTSKLKSALHIKNSIVIPRFISIANTCSILITIITTVFLTLLTTTTMIIVTY